MPQLLFQELTTIVLPEFFASVKISFVKVVLLSTAKALKAMNTKKNVNNFFINLGYIYFKILQLDKLLLNNFFRQYSFRSIPHN